MAVEKANPRHCVGQGHVYKRQFEYTKGFLKAYPTRPKFGFLFQSALCHSGFSLPTIAREYFSNYLRSLRDENLLENTVLMVLGDHGPRYGQVRWTDQGKREERAPFLSITLPQWIREEYPELDANMRRNTEIITSHFDTHATFLHLINLPEQKKTGQITHGTSLLSPLPGDRTCEDAKIPGHYCPCLVWDQVDIEHEHAKVSHSAATPVVPGTWHFAVPQIEGRRGA